MRILSALGAVSLLLALAAVQSPTTAGAATGLAAGKSCHVIRTCNFSRNAQVRGCLSSYSCRQCSLVRQRVRTASGRRYEWRSSCNWGLGS